MFTRVAVLGISASLAVSSNPSVKREVPPDAEKNFAEICAENGFAYEEHTVTTEDGYILSMYRIPG